MTKVWLVRYEHGECVDVFSSQEKAVEWAHRAKLFYPDSNIEGPGAWIEEKAVDPWPWKDASDARRLRDL